MIQQYIPFVFLLPLLGFLVNGLFGSRLPKMVVGIIGTGTVAISFILSCLLFNAVQTGGALEYTAFQWLKVGTLQINASFLVDQLSVWMMLIITGIGSLIHLYSIGYMHHDEGFYKFFAYLNLFIFFMLLLVMGSNYAMMFFGWEGVGLCSYLLIGFWYTNNAYGVAARKAFIMNRVGDLGLLLALFLIAQVFGTLEYKDVLAYAGTGNYTTEILTIITLLLFVGAMGKSAQIPLFTWLPDAMAGPTPVSALIHAATMVTAGIYLLVRSNVLFSLAPFTMDVVLWVGMATSLLAAFIGLQQNDIKKVLAYSTVSQLGLMFVALGVGAYTSGMFHVTTHAFFKALLFLGSGSVIHAMSGEQDIRFMGGLRKKLPITFITFTIGTLAIIGFPLTSGFFSKDEILSKLFEHNKLAWGLALASSMITIIYMLRMYFITFFGTFRGTKEQEHHLHESPISMTLPLMVLAVLSLFGGLLNLPHFVSENGGLYLDHWIHHIPFVPSTEGHMEVGTELGLMGLASGIVLGLLGACYYFFVTKKSLPLDDASVSGFSKILRHKFYVDEIYQFLFVRPTEILGDSLKMIDTIVVDGFVDGIGVLTLWKGRMIRKIQTGNIETYLFGMIGGVLLLFILKMVF